MLDAMDGVRKPNWGFVEVGKPFTDNQNGGGDTITPAQSRGAVWHTLIAGARGIIYFQHSFDGPCPTHHALREQKACLVPTQDAIRDLNGQIKSLAPVLNSQFADGYATGPTAGLKLMSKRTTRGVLRVRGVEQQQRPAGGYHRQVGLERRGRRRDPHGAGHERRHQRLVRERGRCPHLQDQGLIV